MPKPACVKCQRFYQPEKNGFTWLESKPIENRAPPGTQAPELWIPYKIWHSDLWKCHGCGHLLIIGHGQNPIAQDYRTDLMEAAMPHVEATINDC